MILNINHQIWYKVCKPIRHRYGLSTNCVMVLNGSYVYCKYVNNSFTKSKLYSFMSYYDNHRLSLYLTVLINKGYIIECGKLRNRQLYCISDTGMKVIEELNNNYDIELLRFCEMYNVSL